VGQGSIDGGLLFAGETLQFLPISGAWTHCIHQNQEVCSLPWSPSRGFPAIWPIFRLSRFGMRIASTPGEIERCGSSPAVLQLKKLLRSSGTMRIPRRCAARRKCSKCFRRPVTGYAVEGHLPGREGGRHPHPAVLLAAVSSGSLVSGSLVSGSLVSRPSSPPAHQVDVNAVPGSSRFSAAPCVQTASGIR
jgi:hypothetical protein